MSEKGRTFKNSNCRQQMIPTTNDDNNDRTFKTED